MGRLTEQAFLGFQCNRCGLTRSSPGNFHCDSCDGGVFEARYDLSAISEMPKDESPSVWKYAKLLPPVESSITLGEGGTPLFECERAISNRRIFLKDESRNPTSSFTDRGSTVAVSASLNSGISRVVCATHGDTGASVAAYSSKGGLPCTIFAPTSAEASKLLQTLVYGAKLVRIPGAFRNSLERCKAACREGCTNLTLETNVHAVEGEKTTGIEIADQLGWTAPDFVVVPAGTGTNLYATWKGYKEMEQAGIISRLPQMVAVQAEACAPIANAHKEGNQVQRQEATRSIASSIAIRDPLNGHLALNALRESGGTAFTVSEEGMIQAVNILGAKEGIFAEPASAATICAAQMLFETGRTDSSDMVVCVVTGSGLKVPEGIASSLKPRLQSSWDLVSMEQKSLGALGRTKMQILEIIGIAPSYGYDIRKQLAERYRDEISLQAVYQHLDELREMGLITVESTEEKTSRRNYFRLTTRGEETFRSLNTIRDTLLNYSKEETK